MRATEETRRNVQGNCWRSNRDRSFFTGLCERVSAIRRGFYAGYDATGCEYIRLADPKIDERLKDGPPLVSASFVIPYPPGFPIMVPGQVIPRETIDFMLKLDVKEIHGYGAAEGLKLVRPTALTQPVRVAPKKRAA